MESIVVSTQIDAPVEVVFAYIEDPANWPSVWPSLIEVKDLDSLPDAGGTWAWSYKMAGIPLNGTSERLEYVENDHVTDLSIGNLRSTITWKVTPNGAGTKLEISSEYEIDSAILRTVAMPILAKVNEAEGKTIVANVKTMVEAR